MDHANAPVRRKGLGRRIAEHWPYYVMMLPALVILVIWQYKPMYGVIIAFKKYNFRLGIWGSPWCGFDNFVRLFRSYWFPVIMKNTLTISLLGLILSAPTNLILALMVNEITSRWRKKTFQLVSYAPHFISTVVICGMVLMFLSTNGVANQIIRKLGGETVRFMDNPALFKWIFVLSGRWQTLGWGAVIYYAALSKVDGQLLEAAEIDGASRLQRMAHINFPTVLPTFTILLILACGSILGVGYEKVYLLQNSVNLAASEVISTYVYKVGLENHDFSFSTAVGLGNTVVNAVMLLLVNWIARRVGETSLW